MPAALAAGRDHRVDAPRGGFLGVPPRARRGDGDHPGVPERRDQLWPRGLGERGDRDAAGDGVMAVLMDRAQASGIESIGLVPRLGDFNEDLQQLGIDDLRAALRVQLVPEDAARFMCSAMEDEMSG